MAPKGQSVGWGPVVVTGFLVMGFGALAFNYAYWRLVDLPRLRTRDASLTSFFESNVREDITKAVDLNKNRDLILSAGTDGITIPRYPRVLIAAPTRSDLLRGFGTPRYQEAADTDWRGRSIKVTGWIGSRVTVDAEFDGDRLKCLTHRVGLSDPLPPGVLASEGSRNYWFETVCVSLDEWHFAKVSH